MAMYNRRIKFTKEKLINHYERRDSIAYTLYGLLRFLGIIIQNVYCVSSYLVLTWIILLPISWIRHDLYSKLENYLYNSLLFIVSSWSIAAGASVVETGEEYRYLIEDNEVEKLSRGSQNGCSPSKSIATGDHFIKNSPMSEDNACSSPNETSERDTDIRDKLIPKQTKQYSMKRSHESNSKSADLKGIKQDTLLDRSKTDLNDDQTVSGNNTNFANGMDPENGSLATVQDNWSMSGVSCDSCQSPRILLLCNHISTADVPLMMQSFSTLTKQSLLWVLDAQFKPTNFGLVCSSHGDFFIAKNSFTDGTLRDQVLKHPDRNILVLFPEGGFWRKRLEGSNRYAIKNGLPLTKYVTHPRFGAFKDLIDPSVNVTHIVDATLLYDDIRNPLSILDIAMGNRKEPAILNYKVYKRSEINPTEEWLRKLWLDKDELLRRYYENRDSVHEQFANSMRAATLDWIKVVTVHLFYLLVCYLTVYRLFNATGLTMIRARDLYYSNI